MSAWSAFSDSPQTIQPLTYDHREVRAALDSLAADGGTATGDGLAAALGLFERKDRSRGRPRRSCCSRTARRPRAGPDRGRAAGKASRRPDLHRRARDRGGRDPRRLRRPAGPARPGDDAGDRARVGRQGVRSPRTPTSSTPSTASSARPSAPRRRTARSLPRFAAGGLVFLMGAVMLSLRWSGRLP